MIKRFSRFLSFLSWWLLHGEKAGTDINAGITVSLECIPRSMVDARLA